MRAINLLPYLIMLPLISPQWVESATAGRVVHDGVTYDFFTANPAIDDIRLFWKNPRGLAYRDIKALKNNLAENSIELLFATNAGIFEFADDKYKPLGLHIEAGSEIVPLNTKRGRGNFYWKPNGVFGVSGEQLIILPTDLWPPKTTVQFANQSGPLLVVNSKLHPGFTSASQSKHIRNGVGISPSGEAVFAISTQPVTMWAFASLFRDKLGCTDALYLDGSISKLYAPNLGRTEMNGYFTGLWAVVETTKPH